VTARDLGARDLRGSDAAHLAHALLQRIWPYVLDCIYGRPLPLPLSDNLPRNGIAFGNESLGLAARISPTSSPAGGRPARTLRVVRRRVERAALRTAPYDLAGNLVYPGWRADAETRLPRPGCTL
jgi:hypothetical protein